MALPIAERLRSAQSAPASSGLELSATTLSARSFSLIAVVLLVCVPIARALPLDGPAWLTLETLLATCTAGVLPGALILLYVRPQRALTLFELLGLGAAVSLALHELLTVVSLSLHLSVDLLSIALLVCSAVLALAVYVRRGDQSSVVIEHAELVVLALLIPLMFLLYTDGAPFSSTEDEIHISVIRRLAAVARPDLWNIYYARDVVYTYPFPGTHFFMAVVSRLDGLDPLFVYHKMRFFWGGLAILFLYLATLQFLGSRRIALVSTLTALVFVFNGSLANVPGFFWGQLAPFSHASDVAMNVALPGLVVLALYYLHARTRAGAILFFCFTLATAFQLTVVHIRELVQFVVYGVSWVIVLFLLRSGGTRHYLRRAVVMVGATVLVVGAYIIWYRFTVGHIDVLVDLRRAELVDIARSMSLPDFFLTPFQSGAFSVAYDYFAYGWNPFALLAGPFILLAFPRRTGLLLLSVAIFVYLLIVRFPVLSIPYVYFTYFEILYTPVRNIVFFLYMLIGVGVYLLAQLIQRLGHPVRQAAAAVVVGAIVGLTWRWLIVQFPFHPFGDSIDWLMLPAIALYVVAFALYRSRWLINQVARLVPRRTVAMPTLALVMLMLPLAALSVVQASVPGGHGAGKDPPLDQDQMRALIHHNPSLAEPAYQRLLIETRGWVFYPGEPLTADGLPIIPSLDSGAATVQLPALPLGWLASVATGLSATPESLVSGLTCSGRGATTPASDPYVCSPGPRFVTWARANLPTTAVVATDALNTEILTTFLPQQIVAPPNPADSALYLGPAFPDYYALWTKATAAGRPQPFFNLDESPAERSEYLQRLQVTHVLLNPANSVWLRPVLEEMSRTFRLVYADQDGWTLFEVTP